MTRNRLISIVFSFFLLADVTVAANSVEQYETSVVVLHVTKQDWNIDSPWTRGQVKRSSSLATMVGDNLFLTTADAVAAASFIEAQRYGASRKHAAEIVYRDYESNLAAVRLVDAAFVAGMKPLPLGPVELPLNSPVSILHGTGDRLFARRAELRNVVTRASETSPYPFPAYELELNDATSFGNAEPVIERGKLVGLTTSREKNVVFTLPGMVIQHFLKDDLRTEHYRGFPFIGTVTHRLISPDWRRYLGVETDKGVRVSDVFVNSPFYEDLKVDDVIVAVDGTSLDARGNYAHKHWGKIFFSYLIAQKYAGDPLQLTVVRAGKEISFSRTLSRFDRNRSRIAYYRPDIERVPHLIVGGLIFQELSRPYLMTWGDDWHVKAPDRLLFFWYYRNEPPEAEGKRLIILNRVLSDHYNQGHQDLSDNVVEKVNGKTIESIAELRDALADPVQRNGENFAVIEFHHGVPAVMLAYKEMAEAHKRIAKSYSIKTDDSFLQIKE